MPSSLATTPASRGGLRHQASAWVPVLVCVLVIAMESTPYFGADHTTGPLQRFFEYLMHRHFTQPEWWRLHLIIRKGGHFTGYGILSIAWFRAFWMTWPFAEDRNRLRMAAHGLAMLGTLFVASCDEFHQTFLPNRSGSFWDVMLDCSGGLIMQSLVWLCMQRRFRNERN
jgi:VanZ family protein